MADPASISAFFSWAFSSTAGAIAFRVAVLVAVSSYSAASARRAMSRAMADARAAANAQLQDRSITALRSVPAWRVAYGRCVGGGDLRAMFTTDKAGTRSDGSTYTKPKALKHMVITFADHQCQALNEVFIDGIPIHLATVDANGWVTEGEFYKAGVGQTSFGVTIAAGGNYVAASAVTVLSAYDTVLSVYGTGVGDGANDANMVNGTYTLTSGDTVITNTGANPIEVSYTRAVNESTVRVTYKLGTATQTVDTYLNTLIPTQWDSTHKLLDHGYVSITIDLENQRFQGGPPAITFDVSGKLLFDPRTSTTYFNSNPALCVRDFLLGEYGYGVTTADVDDTYVNAAANACETLISGSIHAPLVVTANATLDTINTTDVFGWLNTGDGVQFTTTSGLPAPLALATTYYVIRLGISTIKVATSKANALAGTAINITTTGSGVHQAQLFNYAKYSCDGQFTTDQDKESTLSILAGTMCGQVNYGAKWLVVAGAWTAPVMDLGDDDLMGQISFPQSDTGLDALFNSVRGTYIIQGSSVISEFDAYQNATYVTDDGGTALWEDISLPFTADKVRARNIARVLTEQNRAGQVLTYPSKLKAWPLQIGDRVRVSSSEYGLSLATYRVTDWQFNVASAVELTLQKDASTIYDESDATTADPYPNTNLPSPWIVSALTGLAATSGNADQSPGNNTVRIRVSWSLSTDAYMFDSAAKIIVRWRVVLEGLSTAWSQQEVPGDDTQAYIPDMKPGSAVIISVQPQNGFKQLGPETVINHIITGNIASTQGGGNLLYNASFQLDTNNDGLSDGWATYSAGSTGTITYNRTSDAVFGVTSQSVSATALGTGSGDRIGFWQDIDVTALLGLSFRVSGYVKRIGGSPLYQVFIEYLNGGSYVSSGSGVGGVTTSAWARFQTGIERVPASGVTTVRIYYVALQNGSVTAATLAFDGAQVELGAMVSNFAIGYKDASNADVTATMIGVAPGATADVSLVASAGVTLTGNSATKTTGDGWNEQVYSRDAYTGGAIASAVPTSTAFEFMFGLNTDPATDSNYTSLDYAWYFTAAGAIAVYESGSSPVGGFTYAVGDVMAVVYDGQFVRYTQNGNVRRIVQAPPGLTLYFDSSLASTNVRVDKITFGPYANTFNSRAGNLLDASWWAPGVNPHGPWVSAGAGTDSFVVDTLPDGSSGIVLKAISDGTSDTGPGGGWDQGAAGAPTNFFPVNPSKTYMFVAYTKSVAGASGGLYWGISSDVVCDLNTSTPNTNPYFSFGDPKAASAPWHLHVGWVYPAGTTGHAAGKAGSYNCQTGALTNGGVNFNWKATATQASTRCFSYNQPASSDMRFAWPAVYVCDGSEPSLDDLLSMASVTARNPVTSSNVSTYIASVAIGDAQIASLNADKITVGSLRGRNLQAGSFMTKGTFLVGVPSANAATVTVDNTADFASSGSFIVIDTTNDRDVVTYTGKTATTFTGCATSGGNAILGSHTNGATVIPLLKSMTIDALTNEMRFYGDRGDGTIEELASIGISNVGADFYCGLFGTNNTGNSRVGLSGNSNTASGVYGSSISGPGVFADSDSGRGILAVSQTNWGGEFWGNPTCSQLRLPPLAGRPTNRTAGSLALIYTGGGTTDNRTSEPRLMYTNGTNWYIVYGDTLWNG